VHRSGLLSVSENHPGAAPRLPLGKRITQSCPANDWEETQFLDAGFGPTTVSESQQTLFPDQQARAAIIEATKSADP